MGTYHVGKSLSGQYFWSLRSDNGEIVLTSELYTTKGAAFGGIASSKENSPSDERYMRLISIAGQPYFTLRARNHETIGTSQMYSTAQARETGIAACKRHGPSSGTQDDTGER
jgi:uncharacterized protein YegP (UPF0339 family)